MPKPIHVSVMQLLKEIKTLGLVEIAVVIEMSSSNFDSFLSHLQAKPGIANKPTNLEENMFCMGDVEVRRV